MRRCLVKIISNYGRNDTSQDIRADNVIFMLSRDGMADVKDDECDGADDTKYLSMIKTFL